MIFRYGPNTGLEGGHCSLPSWEVSTLNIATRVAWWKAFLTIDKARWGMPQLIAKAGPDSPQKQPKHASNTVKSNWRNTGSIKKRVMITKHLTKEYAFKSRTRSWTHDVSGSYHSLMVVACWGFSFGLHEVRNQVSLISKAITWDFPLPICRCFACLARKSKSSWVDE